MNTITLVEHVTLPDDTRIIEMRIGRDNVRIFLNDLHNPGYDPQVEVLRWDQLNDVELLYQLFNAELVRTFKVLIEMLGKIHSNKHIYDALT